MVLMPLLSRLLTLLVILTMPLFLARLTLIPIKSLSNIQTGAERMPHDLSHLGFLAGQIGRLITISTTPVIAGDSFEMDAVGALRLSPLRRCLAIDSTVDIFTFYVPHRHVYGQQWIKFMKDGVNATPLPTVNTTGYIDHAA